MPGVAIAIVNKDTGLRRDLSTSGEGAFGCVAAGGRLQSDSRGRWFSLT